MISNLPIIGVPLGDPAGIGPEIAIKAAMLDSVKSIARVILIGPQEVFEKTCKDFSLSLDDLEVHLVKGEDSCVYEYGKIQASCGKAAYDSIYDATLLAKSGIIDAIATTPINKESLRAANIDTIGHTELFASFTQTTNPMTLFQTNNLRVFFLTRHLSLIDACNAITYDKILSGIIETYKSMILLGIENSNVPFVVAGLNPHNGEHGLFGNEEELHIRPAINKAREIGIPVVGPIPADSVFYQARTGRYSAVLSLYHDQGHIATKTYDFDRTISLTLGMPFLRTSVDHGTAFDIAGQGTAQYISMEQAIKVAGDYAKTYKEKYPNFINSTSGII